MNWTPSTSVTPTSTLVLEGANVHRMSGARRVTRALSDGSGLSQEEIVALISGVAAATAVLGLLRAFDVLKDAWPGPHVPSVRP